MAGEASRRVELYEDEEALSLAAAGLFVAQAHRAAQAGRPCNFLLSGGDTPRRCYGMLAAEPLRAAMPWPALQLFWGDERWVPYDDPRSNYGMVRALLLQHVPLAEDQLHPVPRKESPEAAAFAYDTLLRSLFPSGRTFDLALLGLGADGHTASLFPGSPALGETERLACAGFEPGSGLQRITVTAPALNRSALVVFLVAGASKAEILRQVLEGHLDPRRLPAQLIRPQQGRVLWLVDRQAAGRLSPELVAAATAAASAEGEKGGAAP